MPMQILGGGGVREVYYGICASREYMGTRAEEVGQRLKNNQIDNRLLCLLVNLFTGKGTFCCKHLQRSVLYAVQCFSIYFIAGYIISIELIAYLN